MKTVTVVATRDFNYQGRAYRKGQAVTMTAIEAAAQARKGHVTLDQMALPAPEPPAVNTYRTTDMVAQEPASPSTPKNRGRGRTRRRDMVAET